MVARKAHARTYQAGNHYFINNITYEGKLVGAKNEVCYNVTIIRICIYSKVIYIYCLTFSVQVVLLIFICI